MQSHSLKSHSKSRYLRTLSHCHIREMHPAHSFEKKTHQHNQTLFDHVSLRMCGSCIGIMQLGTKRKLGRVFLFRASGFHLYLLVVRSSLPAGYRPCLSVVRWSLPAFVLQRTLIRPVYENLMKLELIWMKYEVFALTRASE